IYALDRGVSGAERFPNTVILDRPHKEGTLVLFRCQPVALFDLIDQRYMTLLRQIDVIGAEEDSTPLSYGYTLSTMPAGLHETETAGESCAMVYVEPGKRFKATMSAGLMGLRLALLNMPEVGADGVRPAYDDPHAIRGMEQVSGDGYLPDATARLPLTPWLVARDMWRLDEIRIRSLSSRGIRNELLESLHKEAGMWKRTAEDAFARRDYAAAMAAAHEAWAYESRTYPLVRSAADDAIKGVIFYLFLLLPFSFFGERLLFGFPKIMHRIFGMAGIFIVVFATLRLTHPAFKLTSSPAMVLLAFITLALAVLVILLLGGKVAEQLRKLRQREEARSIDVNRLSSLRTAFVLGISNLRKRPIRSGLTAATLILMSFTVVSFTSVRFVPRYNKIDTNQDAPYDGILVKRPQWAALDPDVYQSLSALYGDESTGEGVRCAVVPRGWYAGEEQVSIPGRPAPVVNTQPVEADGATVDAAVGDVPEAPQEAEHAWPTVKSITGLDPREPEVTGIDKLLVAGHWLSASDASECIVPTEVAEKLGLTPGDVGKVSLYVLGRRLLVAGLIDGSGLARLLDLNGEPLVPIDYTFVQTTAKAKQETESDRYRHFMPEETIIIPFETLREFGRSYAGQFTIASVAVAMDRSRAEVADREGVIRRYMASKAVNLYVGIGGRSYFYNVPGMLSFSGLRSVLMPLAIAFLIVLNTMLGSVYERFHEIYIFSSIGLAPSHIASLFLAESCVFATIGGVLGYLLGQVLSVAAAHSGLLSGLTLNYSS
ncbi:MAG TPA: ABC transporter permease, partial [Planctomycetota bacterium]|nr:ABC transporter permease [Planctomycetota bacterium]